MAYSRYIPEIKDKDGNIYGVMDKEARAGLDRKYEKPSAGIPASDIASGVIPDVPDWAKAAQKPSYTAAEVGATTEQEVSGMIASAIGDIHSFDLEIVQALPTTNIKTHTIYLLPKTGETNDVYDEYAYINNSWEMIGNTQIDLSGYALKSELPEVPVQDVQVNGVSVLNDGTANIPIASASNLGVVKTPSGKGVYVDTNNDLAINPAGATAIKQGTAAFLPIVPIHQAKSVFYGLAKAAGHDEKNSTEPFGTYTPEAKAAIQSMLGIDLSSIVTQVETVPGTAVTITGQQNTRYMCGEVTSISITPPAAGSIDVFFTSGSTVTVLTLPSTVKMPEWFDASALDTNTVYEILITDGVYGSVMTWAA